MKLEAITYSPVFVGNSEEDGKKIVIYKTDGKPTEVFISIDNGELWSLAPGSEITINFNLAFERMCVNIQSTVWTGSAIGNKYGLIEEQAITVLE